MHPLDQSCFLSCFLSLCFLYPTVWKIPPNFQFSLILKFWLFYFLSFILFSDDSLFLFYKYNLLILWEYFTSGFFCLFVFKFYYGSCIVSCSCELLVVTGNFSPGILWTLLSVHICQSLWNDLEGTFQLGGVIVGRPLMSVGLFQRSVCVSREETSSDCLVIFYSSG